MNKIVQHLWEAIRFENTESLDSGVRPRAPDSLDR